MNAFSLRLFGFLTILAGAVHAAPMIVDEGGAHAEIVVAEKPTRSSKLAARELQAVVGKITGQKLPIVTAPTR